MSLSPGGLERPGKETGLCVCGLGTSCPDCTVLAQVPGSWGSFTPSLSRTCASSGRLLAPASCSCVFRTPGAGAAGRGPGERGESAGVGTPVAAERRQQCGCLAPCRGLCQGHSHGQDGARLVSCEAHLTPARGPHVLCLAPGGPGMLAVCLVLGSRDPRSWGPVLTVPGMVDAQPGCG